MTPISSTKIAIKYSRGLGAWLGIGFLHRIDGACCGALAAVTPANLVHAELRKATDGNLTFFAVIDAV